MNSPSSLAKTEPHVCNDGGTQVEFWRRIAVGASFGTGTDSIVIDPSFDADDADEDQLRRFGGRRVLGSDAIAAAYVLMAVAGGSVALALVAAAQL